MVDFLLFLFAGIGITNLAVNASILDIPRDFVSSYSTFFEELIACMMCSGFWVGFLMGAAGGMNPLYSGAIISFASLISGYLVECLTLSSELMEGWVEMMDQARNIDNEGER